MKAKKLLIIPMALVLLSSSTVYSMTSKRETQETKERGGAVDRIIAAKTDADISSNDIALFNKYKDSKEMHPRAKEKIEKKLTELGSALKKEVEKGIKDKKTDLKKVDKLREIDKALGEKNPITENKAISETETKTALEIKEQDEIAKNFNKAEQDVKKADLLTLLAVSHKIDTEARNIFSKENPSQQDIKTLDSLQKLSEKITAEIATKSSVGLPEENREYIKLAKLTNDLLIKEYMNSRLAIETFKAKIGKKSLTPAQKTALEAIEKVKERIRNTIISRNLEEDAKKAVDESKKAAKPPVPAKPAGLKEKLERELADRNAKPPVPAKPEGLRDKLEREVADRNAKPAQEKSLAETIKEELDKRRKAMLGEDSE